MSLPKPPTGVRLWLGNQSGVAAIEFAVLSPLLVLLLIAVVELGLTSYQTMQVQSAAEAGALYAAKHGFDLAGIEAAVTGATGLSGVTATPEPQSFCGCPQASGIGIVSCNATCSGGVPPGGYVAVHASYAHEAIMPNPWTSSPLVLTGESTVRLK